MPELHLKHPGFPYSACRSFTKHQKFKETIQKFKETGNLKLLYRNESDEACFAHDGNSDCKDLAERTTSDKILKDKAYEIARNHNYDGYQRGLASMVYNFFDKKTGSGATVKSKAGISGNEQLAKELHKPVIKKFKRRKVYARFKDNIWAADLTELESYSSKNKNVKYLLCVIDVFTKYAWVKPLKGKKGKTVLNAFIKIVNKSNRKPNKLWVDQGREFYNKLMQEWLDNNDILMYSTNNEGKSAITERFIKTLKIKIYKKMTANDNKSYLPYLNKLVDQYNNTYHHSTNKKPINARCSALTEKLRPMLKLLSLKLMIESELLSIRIFLVKATLKIGQEKYLLLILF